MRADTHSAHTQNEERQKHTEALHEWLCMALGTSLQKQFFPQFSRFLVSHIILFSQKSDHLPAPSPTSHTESWMNPIWIEAYKVQESPLGKLQSIFCGHGRTRNCFYYYYVNCLFTISVFKLSLRLMALYWQFLQILQNLLVNLFSLTYSTKIKIRGQVKILHEFACRTVGKNKFYHGRRRFSKPIFSIF